MRRWKFNDVFCFDIFSQYEDQKYLTCSGLVMADTGDNKIRYNKLYEKIFTEDDLIDPDFTVGFDDDELTSRQQKLDYWKPYGVIEYFFRANVKQPNYRNPEWPDKNIEVISTLDKFMTELPDV